MNETRKFLDQKGVEYLWSKLSMQDYPNNETLMAVIEAIDETKADKTDIVQSDWEQNDEVASDYIKNRTHYDTKEILLDIILTEDSYNGFAYRAQYNGIEFNVGQTYIVEINGTAYECVCYEERGSGYNTLASSVGGFIIYPFQLDCQTTGRITVKARDLKQLDEKFIPDSIARIIDLPNDYISYNEQSLAQNQQSQARTNIGVILATDEEVLNMLIEEDLLTVLVDSDQNVLVDNENNILY